MCAHFVRLPPSLSANEFEGAGRQAEAKVFTIMCVTQESTTDLIVLATYPLLSQ